MNKNEVWKRSLTKVESMSTYGVGEVAPGEADSRQTFTSWTVRTKSFRAR